MKSALVNRDVIGQAKGILNWAKVSQQTNRKLYVVAADLAHTAPSAADTIAARFAAILRPRHTDRDTPTTSARLRA